LDGVIVTATVGDEVVFALPLAAAVFEVAAVEV